MNTEAKRWKGKYDDVVRDLSKQRAVSRGAEVRIESLAAQVRLLEARGLLADVAQQVHKSVGEATDRFTRIVTREYAEPMAKVHAALEQATADADKARSNEPQAVESAVDAMLAQKAAEEALERLKADTEPALARAAQSEGALRTLFYRLTRGLPKGWQGMSVSDLLNDKANSRVLSTLFVQVFGWLAEMALRQDVLTRDAVGKAPTAKDVTPECYAMDAQDEVPAPAPSVPCDGCPYFGITTFRCENPAQRAAQRGPEAAAP